MNSEIINTTFTKMGNRSIVCCIQTNNGYEIVKAYTVKERLHGKMSDEEMEANAFAIAKETLKKLEEKYFVRSNS